MSSHHLGPYKGTFYIIDDVLIANLSPAKALLHGCVFKLSVFISLRFQIDPIWFALS